MKELPITAGPFALPMERFLFLFAFLIAILVGWLAGRRRGIAVEPVLTRMLLGGALSARLVFVVLYLEDYLARPMSIFNIADGGFQLEAGLLVAALIGGFYAWRSQRLRAPLGIAVFSGLLTWGGTLGAVSAMQATQPSLANLPLQNLSGEPVQLEHDGQPMVVNLWATWCPPCRREMPVLEEAQQREEGIKFVFINQGEGPETIQQYLDEESLQLKNVLLDKRSATLQQLGINGLPTTLFYDESGELVESHFGELSSATLRKNLNQF